ncbi:hypothetical protein EBZ80_14725 [bacterium]|nr:hypothetical protein [bacterium]
MEIIHRYTTEAAVSSFFDHATEQRTNNMGDWHCEELFALGVVTVILLHVVVLIALCALLPRPVLPLRVSHHPLTMVPAIASVLLLMLSGTVTVLLLKKRWYGERFGVFLERHTDQRLPTRLFLMALWIVTIVLCATFVWIMLYRESLRVMTSRDPRRQKRTVLALLSVLSMTGLLLIAFVILCVSKVRKMTYWTWLGPNVYALADRFCQTGDIQPWAQLYCTREKANNYHYSKTCVAQWALFLNMVEVAAKDRGKPQCLQRALRSVPVCVLYSVEIDKTPLVLTQDAFGHTRDESTIIGWMNTIFPAKRLAEQFCQPNGTMEPVEEWLRTATQDSSRSLKWALFFYHVMLTHDYPCRDKALEHIPHDVDIFEVQEFLNALLTDVQRTTFRAYVDDLPIAVNLLKRPDPSLLQEVGQIAV